MFQDESSLFLCQLRAADRVFFRWSLRRRTLGSGVRAQEQRREAEQQWQQLGGEQLEDCF